MSNIKARLRALEKRVGAGEADREKLAILDLAVLLLRSRRQADGTKTPFTPDELDVVARGRRAAAKRRDDGLSSFVLDAHDERGELLSKRDDDLDEPAVST